MLTDVSDYDAMIARDALALKKANISDLSAALSDERMGRVLAQVRVTAYFDSYLYHSSRCKRTEGPTALCPESDLLIPDFFRKISAGEVCDSCFQDCQVIASFDDYTATIMRAVSAVRSLTLITDELPYSDILSLEAVNDLRNALIARRQDYAIVARNGELSAAFGSFEHVEAEFEKAEAALARAYTDTTLREKSMEMALELIVNSEVFKTSLLGAVYEHGGGAELDASRRKGVREIWANVPHYVIVNMNHAGRSFYNSEHEPLITFIRHAWQQGGKLSCMPAALFEAYDRITGGAPSDYAVVDEVPPADVLEIMNSFHLEADTKLSDVYATAMLL